MTMAGLKCPICGNELEKSYNGGVFCPNLDCELAETILGVESVEIWTDTKKKLDIAVDRLKGIKTYYDDSYADPHTFVNWHIVAQRLANDADDAIKTITALEQKDVK